ncbi:MAG: hypothetical protein LBV50_09815 [Novosphingobium sp.]|jgi:tetratricopeptide (TPR) repeat protein|nr:hypothetical protein [Novosphingobium sp.]
MSKAQGGALCPDEIMATLVGLLQQDEPAGLARLDELAGRYPDDARLLFLKGSMMAARKDYDGARKAMRQAVDAAPDFAIARFQLGFLLLTCGEPWAARETWGPLHGLPEGHYLLHFVRGLSHLIHDAFPAAIGELERGIAANSENLPLNRDMRLIIDEIRRKELAGGAGGQGSDVSSAQLLLQQASLRATRH